MRVLMALVLAWMAWAVASPAATLIVLNKSDHEAAFVDAATGKVLGKAPTGRFPHEAAVSPDGAFAYVSNYGSGQEPGNTITVLDVRRRAAARTLDLGEFRRPHGVAVSRDGSLLWVTCEANQAVLEVDASSGKVLRHFNTGQRVSHMVVPGPDEKKLYVTNIGSGTTSVIDRSTQAVLNLDTGPGSEGIDISPDGRRVLVASRSMSAVTVIDTASDKIVGRFPSGGYTPIRVKFAPDGRRVLVSNAESNRVALWELGEGAKARQIGAIETGTTPVGILVEPQGKRAFVANTQSNVVSILDLEKLRIEGTLSTGKEPDGMAWAQ